MDQQGTQQQKTQDGTLRVRFVVTRVEPRGAQGGAIVTLSARGDDSIPQNRRISQAAPVGTIQLNVDSPEATELFALNKPYWIDIVAAEAGQAAGSTR